MNACFRKNFEVESPSESEENENVVCFICDNQFSNDMRAEMWVRCTGCFERCYKLCTFYNLCIDPSFVSYIYRVSLILMVEPEGGDRT